MSESNVIGRPVAVDGSRVTSNNNPLGQVDYRWVQGFAGAAEEIPEHLKDAPSPKDGQDYVEYKNHFEQWMYARTAGQGTESVGLFIKCEMLLPDGKPVQLFKPSHFRAPFKFACNHVIIFDPNSPEQMFFIPFERNTKQNFGYNLCKTCWGSVQRKKFQFHKEMCMKCGPCCEEAAFARIAKNPELYVDLSLK